MKEVFEDPAVQQRGIAIDVMHSSGANVRLVRNPIRFARTPMKHLAPPELGDHTDRVLQDELGLTAEQLAGLRSRGII
jgi:crotonobetainyl-CoA:carnitine CoA-transferase CaiB-like acyl-CoA transferase